MALNFHLLIPQCFRIWMRSKFALALLSFLFMLCGQMMTPDICVELSMPWSVVGLSETLGRQLMHVHLFTHSTNMSVEFVPGVVLGIEAT